MRRTDAFDTPGPRRDEALAGLQDFINGQLQMLYLDNKAGGDKHLAGVLVNWVEDFATDGLEALGYRFARIDYGGDVDYRNSTQDFSDGAHFGTGIILEFRGFHCAVSWREP